MKKLTIALITALTIGFFTLLGHEMGFWGPKPEPGVIYLENYDAVQNAQHLHETCVVWTQVLHKIWIDNPQYVEDVLFETDEFIQLDSLGGIMHTDCFEFWSQEDSVAYKAAVRQHEIEAELYLHHMREVDEMAIQAAPCR